MRIKNMIKLLLKLKITGIGTGLGLIAWLAIRKTPFYESLLTLKYFNIIPSLCLFMAFLILDCINDKEEIVNLLNE